MRATLNPMRLRSRLKTSTALWAVVASLALPMGAQANNLLYDHTFGGTGGAWNKTPGNTTWLRESGTSGNFNTPDAFEDGDTVIFDDGAKAVQVGENVSPASITFASNGFTLVAPVFAPGSTLVVAGSGMAIDVVPAPILGTDGANIALPLVSAGSGGTSNITVNGESGSVGRLFLNGDNSGSTGRLTLGNGTDSGGFIVNNAAYGGGVDINSGAFRANTGSSIGGSVNLLGGSLAMQGGTFGAPVTNSGGTVTVGQDTTVNFVSDDAMSLTINNAVLTGNVVVFKGQYTNNGDLTGTIRALGDGVDPEFGNVLINSGTVSGRVTNDGGDVNVVNATLQDRLVNTAGTATLSGVMIGNVTNSDQLQINAAATLTGDLRHLDGQTNNQGIITGAVRIDAGTLTTTNSLGSTVVLTGGTLEADAGTITGRITNNGGTINADGATLTAGVQNNSGDLNLNVSTAGPITNVDGAVAISTGVTVGDIYRNLGTGTTTNEGIISGNVVLSGGGLLTNGTVTNAGTIGGTVVLSTGATLDNVNGNVAGLVTNNGGNVDINGGTFGSDIVNNSGTVDVLGTVTTTATILNRGGTVTVGPDATLDNSYVSTAGATVNQGTITGAVVLSGTGTNTLANTGTLSSTAHVSGASVLTNSTGGSIAGQVTLTGGRVNAAGGTFAVDLLNNGGLVVVSEDTLVSVLNRAGTTTINSGDELDGDVTLVTGIVNNNGAVTGDVFVTGGQLNNNGDIGQELRVLGGVADSNGGTVTGLALVNGGTLNAADTMFTAGVRGISGTINFDGDVTAELLNVGAMTTVLDGHEMTGTATVTGGSFTMNGSQIGDIIQSVGAVTVDGDVNGLIRSNSGTLTVTSGIITGEVLNLSDLATLSGATINGGIRTLTGATTNITGPVTAEVMTQGGTTNITGALDGNVIHASGIGTQSAQVDGTLRVETGTYALNDQVTEAVTLVGGTLTATGSTMDSGATMTNGALNFFGTNTAPTVVNFGGAMTLSSGASLSGNVTQNGGTTVSNGTIMGTARIQANTWTHNTDAITEGLTTLVGGTLNANGGRFEGGLNARSGTLNYNANTFGNVNNNGVAFTLAPGVRLIGNLTQNSGSFVSTGTITGRLISNGGTVQLNAGSNVNLDLRLNDGVVTALGGTIAGNVTAVGGDLNVNGVLGTNVVNSGAATRIAGSGTLDGSYVQTGGAGLNNGRITGNVQVSRGNLTNAGEMQGTLIVSGTGAVTNTGTIGGQVRLAGGALNANGGTFQANLINDGGLVTLNETTAFADKPGGIFGVDNVTGTIAVTIGHNLEANTINRTAGIILLDGDLDGNLTNLGTVIGEGQVLGELVNLGTFDSLSGGSSAKAFTLTGPTSVVGLLLDNRTTGVVTVSGANLQVGSLINRGEIQINNNKVLVSNSFVRINDGLVNIDNGTLAAADGILMRDTSEIVMNNGTLEGDVTLATTLNATGNSTVTSDGAGPIMLDVSGPGQLLIDGGAFDVVGDLIVAGSATVAVADGATLSVETMDNSGTLTLGAGATLNASTSATNNGNRALFGDGVVVNGAFINTGIVAGQGTLAFNGGLTGGGKINLRQSTAPTDRVIVGGTLGDQSFDLDINLAGTVGRSDQIVMTSDAIVNGTIGLNFFVSGEGGEQADDVVVIDASLANGITADQLLVSGLPDPDDIITYGLSVNGSGDVVVFDALNQGISSLAGNIVLAQSLIGSVINRPSSPFVSGLAFEDENPCGAGVWARAIGGQADSTGRVEQTNGDLLAFDGSISADYYGIQLGGDYACFNGFYNGWDVALGGIAGANFGQSTQPVFAPDPNSADGLSDTLTSVTDVDFTQTYAGLYVAAVRDALSVDLQYRIEQTEFTANNVGAGGGRGLGLNDETFKSKANTLSGAVSYAYPIKDTNLTLVPTAGFAYSQISTDPIVFDDRGVIQIDDFESKTGFVGATLSRTRFGSDGVSALTQFGTVTVYNDFAENPTSTYTPADNSAETTLSSENLGTYGEISAGVNYTRILQPGELGNAKQFNASLRGDIRYSDRLESWGLTAQARLQF